MSRYLLLQLLFVAVWLAVSGSITPANLILAVLVSTLALGLVRHELRHGGRYRLRPLRLLSLLILFARELALSAWKVAVVVTRRRIEVQPGIFAYPLTVKTDFQITLLANLISLTPGTLSIEVSPDRKTLYVHAMDCSNIEATKNDIRTGFEKKIMEAFEQ